MIKRTTDALEKQMKSGLMVWARTIDHRIGHSDTDRPDLPILTMREAYISLAVRSFIYILNTITCGFVIASIIRHW